MIPPKNNAPRNYRVNARKSTENKGYARFAVQGRGSRFMIRGEINRKHPRSFS
jgi:hypothetical protein